MHRRGLGSKDEILGYARQVADEVGQSDGVSVSDIMMFAKRVAAHPSESGVVTESFGVDGFSNDMFSDNSLGGSALLRFARGVAQRGDLSSAGASSAVGAGDVLAFARKVAQQAAASESGIGTGLTEGTDIMAFARKAARAVSQSGISQGASESDVLAFARKAARDISQSGVSANDSDILTFARKAADDVSKSGVVSETSVLAFARQVANGMHSEVTETSAATSRSDFLAFARRAAQDVSKSGVASSVASGAESDIYAFAQQVAGDVSRSGVHGASEAASSVRESDIFAIAQRHTGLPESKTPANPASSVASASDIMQFAQKVAQDVSEAGYSASEASDAQLLESRSGAESASDVLAFARRAAQAVGSSTVPSEDLFVPARRVLREGSSVSGGELDLFAVARTAADQVSCSGVQSSVAGSGTADFFAHVESSRSGAGSDLFAAARTAAAQVSDAGLSVPGSLEGGLGELFTHAESASGASDNLDLFAAARGAAEQVLGLVDIRQILGNLQTAVQRMEMCLSHQMVAVEDVRFALGLGTRTADPKMSGEGHQRMGSKSSLKRGGSDGASGHSRERIQQDGLKRPTAAIALCKALQDMPATLPGSVHHSVGPEVGGQSWALPDYAGSRSLVMKSNTRRRKSDSLAAVRATKSNISAAFEAVPSSSAAVPARQEEELDTVWDDGCAGGCDGPATPTEHTAEVDCKAIDEIL
eukprot:s373_g1.t1